MGRIGFKMKTVFLQKELKQFGISVLKFGRFIKEVHERIATEIILDNREGYILPFNLGAIRLKKKKKTQGVYTIEARNNKNNAKQYNRHTFSYVYYVTWDKYFNYIGANTRKKKLFYVRYKGNEINWFKIYQFKVIRSVARQIKDLINQDKLNF